MKVAIYVRTSKESQHPENQTVSLNQFAKDRKYEVHKVYVDQTSGAKDTRPALYEMMKDAREGRFEAVLIWKLDRLGRSLQHLIKIVESLKRYNIDLICKTQNIDTTTSTGKFTFYLFGAIAELERELITERINLGLERAKNKGKQLGRPKGSKDKKDRRKSGYYQRWSKKTPPHNEDMISMM
jgi:DNA invertase Pin-like site-specific DNA recombinase